MKKTLILGLIGLAVGAQASPVIYYGGDMNGVDGLASQISTAGGFTDSQTYDNFTLTSAMTIDGVFGRFLDTSTSFAQQITWEIRSGMSSGNGGTLLFSGTTAATNSFTGFSAFSINEREYSSNVSAFNLAAGNYWLSVALAGGDGQAYASATSGANGVGGPLNDGNSFFNAPVQFSANYAPTGTQLGSGVDGDFAFGLRGASTVPEPASFAVLGLGAVALLRRRRK
ncbi:MAG: PEP-CTERM sorting domain-containing protein [Armatimonadota bacterium]